MAQTRKQYLFLSDFDQTLSFNDSGLVLSKLLDVDNFDKRVAGLSEIHLVQQGGELSYLLLHDPEFRRVRKEDLAAVGKQIRERQNRLAAPQNFGFVRFVTTIRRRSSSSIWGASPTMTTSALKPECNTDHCSFYPMRISIC